jgi:tetratricopeptide (TPR) repeat protein
MMTAGAAATPQNEGNMPDTSSSPARRAAAWGIALALAVAVLAVYGRSWSGQFHFVNFDDDQYVTGNSRVRGGLTADGVVWALTTLDAYNWHPLTWLSLQLDAELFGTSATGCHRTNTLLHAANTALLFGLLLRLTGALWRSAAVAALFGLHPTHVESVAWVTERKDVLSTLFWLLTTAAYAWYARRPAAGRYLLVLVPFALGLMSKPMLVTLPATLLLLDYWPLRRWPPEEGRPAEQPPRPAYAPASLRRLVIEKLPLFALALASVPLTFRAQSEIVWTLGQFPVPVRVANALVSYVKYLGMTLWPVDLAAFYPHPRDTLPWWQPVGAGVLLTAVTGAVLWAGRARRYLVVGWLWYLGTLVPVIGLVQVGLQGMADRYLYVPSIGLFLMAAWGMADLRPRGSPRAAAAALTVAALAACLVLTWRQVGYWRDSETLWRHALAATGDTVAAHEKLGLALADKGQPEEAVEHLQAAVRLEPRDVQASRNLGFVLERLGRRDEAAVEFERVLQLAPGSATAHLHLGRIRRRQGRHEDAVRLFDAALRLEPTSSEARVELAAALADSGEFTRAREQLDVLLRHEPDSPTLHNVLGILFRRQGQLTEAVASFDRALALRPSLPEAWNNKGLVLETLGRLPDAVTCLERAVELDPQQQGYRLNLAHALYESGNHGPAAKHYAAAFRISPDWPRSVLAEAWLKATHPDARRRNGTQALRNAQIACEGTGYQVAAGLDVLGAAHAEVGHFDEAATWARAALRLVPDGTGATFADGIQQRLSLYEQRRPYREAPPDAAPR